MTFWSLGRALGLVLFLRNALPFAFDNRLGSEIKKVITKWAMYAESANRCRNVQRTDNILYPAEYHNKILDNNLPLPLLFKSLAVMQRRKNTTVMILEPTVIRSQYSKLQYSFK